MTFPQDVQGFSVLPCSAKQVLTSISLDIGGVRCTLQYCRTTNEAGTGVEVVQFVNGNVKLVCLVNLFEEAGGKMSMLRQSRQRTFA